MKSHLSKLLIAVLVVGYSGSSFSATTTYTDEASFLNDAGSELFVIDFDGLANPSVGDGVFSGQVDFGSPEATDPDSVYYNSGAMSDNGSTTATNNVGPVDGSFLTPEAVFAFSLEFSSSGNPQTISIFDLGGTIIDSVLTPAGGFFGLLSDTQIGSFLVTNGIFSGTGEPDRFFIDDFKAYSTSPIPVPAAVWLFGSALIGFIGMSRRRKVN